MDSTPFVTIRQAHTSRRAGMVTLFFYVNFFFFVGVGKLLLLYSTYNTCEVAAHYLPVLLLMMPQPPRRSVAAALAL